MAPHTADYQLYVGIDIAATTFTAAWMAADTAPTPPVTHPQRPGGFAALQRQLTATGSAPAATLVVLEATGSYWVALAVTLHTVGYCVSVINPLQAHHFAKAQSRRAKTDPLDAENLAQLAAALRPAVWTPPPAVYHDTAQGAPGQRLTARDALVTLRQQTRNQRHALVQGPVVVASVRDHLDGVIALLNARIADREAEIATMLAVSDWAESLACLTSAPGITGALWADDGGLDAGEHDELHPVCHARGSDGRVPAGQDGIGADVPHLGHERARADTHRAWRTKPTAHRLISGQVGTVGIPGPSPVARMGVLVVPRRCRAPPTRVISCLYRERPDDGLDRREGQRDDGRVQCGEAVSDASLLARARAAPFTPRHRLLPSQQASQPAAHPSLLRCLLRLRYAPVRGVRHLRRIGLAH